MYYVLVGSGALEKRVNGAPPGSHTGIGFKKKVSKKGMYYTGIGYKNMIMGCFLVEGFEQQANI